jgi:ribonuclease G
MPDTHFIGVSRKITDPEMRKNLIFSTLNMAKGDEGIIARTAAAKATHEVKLREVNYCRKLYQTILDKFKSAQVGDLIYTDSPLFMRVLRDIDYSTLSEICVGTKKLEESVLSTLKLIPTKHTIPVTHYGANKDMFYEVGLHEQMMDILKPRVELENGAYIIIEKTEALTSIDVNTGSFVGDNSLEQTVYETNILAAAEIARQVKLRNIGGIVVVDFIDMTNEEHRKIVYETLEKALASDWAKCKIAPMSRFGLIEFTRKRMGISPISIMTTTCRHCGGAGDTRSQEFILLDVRAKLLDILSKGHNFINIDMNSGVCNKLLGWTGMIESIKACYPDAVIYVVPHRSYSDDTITFTVCASAAEKPENGTLLY